MKSSAVAPLLVVVAAGTAFGQFDPNAQWAGFKNDAAKRGSRFVEAGPAMHLAWGNEDLPTPGIAAISIDAEGFLYYVTEIAPSEAVDDQGNPIPGGENYVIKIDPETGAEVARSPNLGGGAGSYSGLSIGVDAFYYTRSQSGDPAFPNAVLKLDKNDLSIIAELPIPNVPDSSGAGGADAEPSVRGEPLLGSVPNAAGNVNMYVFDRAQNRMLALDSVTGALRGVGEPAPGVAATYYGRIGPLVTLPNGDQGIFYAGNAGTSPNQATMFRDTGALSNAVDFVWDAPVTSFNWWGSGALSNDGTRIYLTTFNDNEQSSLWAINVSNGSVAWSVPGLKFTEDELNFFSRPSVFAGRVYAVGGFGVITAFADLGSTYEQLWEYRDGIGEFTAVAVGGVPDGSGGFTRYIYATRQGDWATGYDPETGVYTDPAELVVLRDDGDTYTEMFRTTLDGTLVPTRNGSASPALDAEGNLYVAGGSPVNTVIIDGHRPGQLFKFSVESEETCPADFDGNETVNVNDLLGFLGAFRTQDASADFDGNGNINVNDLLGFLGAFRTGC